ncbi:MAG: hypothetical protein ACRDT7_06505 [Microbacterium sp.]
MTLESEIARIEADLRAAGWAAHANLQRAFNVWSNLAAEVDAYEATVDDYTNDVRSRDYIAEFSAAASDEVQKYIADEVTAADDRFRASTEPDVEGLISQYFRIDNKDGWWWRQRPTGGPLADYLTERRGDGR